MVALQEELTDAERAKLDLSTRLHHLELKYEVGKIKYVVRCIFFGSMTFDCFSAVHPHFFESIFMWIFPPAFCTSNHLRFYSFFSSKQGDYWTAVTPDVFSVLQNSQATMKDLKFQLGKKEHECESLQKKCREFQQEVCAIPLTCTFRFLQGLLMLCAAFLHLMCLASFEMYFEMYLCPTQVKGCLLQTWINPEKVLVKYCQSRVKIFARANTVIPQYSSLFGT